MNRETKEKSGGKLYATKRVIKLVGKAIGDFSLIDQDDRIAVALSGGKDSWSLLYSLLDLRKRAPVNYEICAVTIVTKTNDCYMTKVVERLNADKIPHRSISCDMLSIISDHLSKGSSPCSLCSRIRRGVLYSFALREGWNKIALGHHMDDFVETLLLNLFFNGSIKGMSPRLVTDDGKNVVIRPLVYVREENTAKMAVEMGLPVQDCGCIFQLELNSKRRWVKKILAELEKEIPNLKSSILSSMGRVFDRHLLKPTIKT